MTRQRWTEKYVHSPLNLIHHHVSLDRIGVYEEKGLLTLSFNPYRIVKVESWYTRWFYLLFEPHGWDSFSSRDLSRAIGWQWLQAGKILSSFRRHARRRCIREKSVDRKIDRFNGTHVEDISFILMINLTLTHFKHLSTTTRENSSSVKVRGKKKIQVSPRIVKSYTNRVNIL